MIKINSFEDKYNVEAAHIKSIGGNSKTLIVKGDESIEDKD